ncbi:hypothetical protein CKQ90_33390, partial [Klebsiella pneumoniae]
ARMLRRSMLALLLAAFMQGIAFACLYPIIDALLRGDAPQLLNWAMAFSVAAIARMLRRSMLALLLAAFMQGIAFACLYPIIDALL